MACGFLVPCAAGMPGSTGGICRAFVFSFCDFACLVDLVKDESDLLEVFGWPGSFASMRCYYHWQKSYMFNCALGRTPSRGPQCCACLA